MEIVSKQTGSSLTATEFNQIPDELENLISKSGQTPSSSDLTQVTKAISQMVGDADFYNTSGTANAIILSAVSPRIAPSILSNGLRARFIAYNNNTSEVTINLNNLGAKTVMFNGSPIGAGDIISGKFYEVVYVSNSDIFELRTIDTSSLLNKKMITNCILEAPNGVATYSGSTVTVKGGIKVLMPNGLNADGTLKNIEYTLSQDADLVNNTNGWYGCIFLDKDLGVQGASSSNVFYQETLNTAGEISTSTYNQYWYKPSENMWYKKLPNTSNWISCNVCPICYPTTSSRGISSPTTIITNLYNLKPISLKTVDDSDGHWVFKGKTIIAYADYNFPQNYNVTFDLTDHLPNDGYYYEVLLNSYCGTTGSNTMSMTVEGRIQQYFYRVHVPSGGTGGHSSGRFIVGPDRRLRIYSDSGFGTTSVMVYLGAYRKVV